MLEGFAAYGRYVERVPEHPGHAGVFRVEVRVRR